MEGGNSAREVLEGANPGEGGAENGVVLQRDPEEELKREISCHPMFGLLKGTHLSCLKICSGDEEEVPSVVLGHGRRPLLAPENHTDLDLFMEEYSAALVELTQAIQKPVQEATAFIDFMYSILDDVTSADGTAATGTPDQ